MAKNKKKKKLPKNRNPEATKLRNPHFGKARIIPKKEAPKPDVSEEW